VKNVTLKAIDTIDRILFNLHPLLATLPHAVRVLTAMKRDPIRGFLLASMILSIQACDKHSEKHGQDGHGDAHAHHAEHKIIVTSPVARDVVSTQPYVCQIHSRSHIEVRALEGGYLEDILVKEGQSVKKGDHLFKILPVLYQARLDSDIAEANLAEIELQNTEKLFNQSIVAQPEVALAKAKLAKAQAKVKLAQAELNFADIKAPFDGIVDRQRDQLGSLIEEGEVLTTLSDNAVMWVYFNVPEAHYLEYKVAMDQKKNEADLSVDLMLANHKRFSEIGRISAIEADFNSSTGNIAFRADFPNPDGLLRHGQTGTVLLHRTNAGAIVIPQRAKFEILAKNYVYVVDDDGVVHQREIGIQSEQDDIYLIEEGLGVDDRIILEGVRQVRDGDQVEYEFQAAEVVLNNLKHHAE
jgi:membrane fusion protein (multidrug efflux system)